MELIMKKQIGSLVLVLLLSTSAFLQANPGVSMENNWISLDTVQMEILQGGKLTATCAGAVVFLVGEATFGAAIAATGNVVGAAWWFTRMMGESLAVIGACS